MTNVPTYGTASVAQLVFALLLELCHQVALHSAATHAGEWPKSADFSFWKTPLIELQGKTMGIVGFGRIGCHVGEIAAAAGMLVIAADESRKNAPNGPGFRWCDVDELMSASDVVSLHCPLLPSHTRNDECRNFVQDEAGLNTHKYLARAPRCRTGPRQRA